MDDVVDNITTVGDLVKALQGFPPALPIKVAHAGDMGSTLRLYLDTFSVTNTFIEYRAVVIADDGICD